MGAEGQSRSQLGSDGKHLDFRGMGRAGGSRVCVRACVGNGSRVPVGNKEEEEGGGRRLLRCRDCSKDAARWLASQHCHIDPRCAPFCWPRYLVASCRAIDNSNVAPPLRPSMEEHRLSGSLVFARTHFMDSLVGTCVTRRPKRPGVCMAYRSPGVCGMKC